MAAQTVQEQMQDEERKRLRDQMSTALKELYNRDEGILIDPSARVLVIPGTHTKKTAIELLQRSIKDDEEEVQWRKDINYRYEDGLVALQRVIKRLWGFAEQQPIHTFFGTIKPGMQTVATSYGVSIEVPSGKMALMAPDGSDVVIQTHSVEGNFTLTAVCRKLHVPMLKLLWENVVDELKTNSIYKGQAITSDFKFLNIAAVQPDKIILAHEARRQIVANIMTPIRKTRVVLDNGIPLKRGALLEGPYGTGKSLTAGWTAKEAVEHGWTFISVLEGQHFEAMLSLARRYQPAVVFVEDIDKEAFGDAENKGINAILNTFDGMDKTAQIMVVLTTNHVDRIAKGLLRPGRLDAVIHVGELDLGGTRQMLESHGLEMDGIDVEAVHEASKEMTPAFLAEAIRKTKLYSLSHNGHEAATVSTDDLVVSIKELRHQWELMQGPQEHKTPNLDKAMRDLVRPVAERAIYDAVDDDSGMLDNEFIKHVKAEQKL